jgi:hypothetical protein
VFATFPSDGEIFLDVFIYRGNKYLFIRSLEFIAILSVLILIERVPFGFAPLETLGEDQFLGVISSPEKDLFLSQFYYQVGHHNHRICFIARILIDAALTQNNYATSTRRWWKHMAMFPLVDRKGTDVLPAALRFRRWKI